MAVDFSRLHKQAIRVGLPGRPRTRPLKVRSAGDADELISAVFRSNPGLQKCMADVLSEGATTPRDNK